MHDIKKNKQFLTCDQKYFTAGIDLGTTNSVIATIQNKNIKIISNKEGEKLTPSIVHFTKEKKIIVGTNAKKKLEKDPLNTITSIKRLIGITTNKIKKLYPNIPYNLTNNKKNFPIINTTIGYLSPIQISSEILKSLKKSAEAQLNKTLKKVVISVPAYFDEIQRKQIKQSAKLANLEVLRLINEPTAAALAYGLNKKNKKGIIAVYDLGGGTFDISILKLNKEVFEVLSTSGSTQIGGDDFDNLIEKWIYKKLSINTKDIKMKRKILNIANKAKISLTKNHKTTISVNNTKIILSREDLNALIYPLIKKTLLITKQALNDAQIKIKNISEIILVGGSTKIPIIIKEIENFFKRNILTSINPEKIVAIGAAMQANILYGNKNSSKILLLDITPLSLGIETLGGEVEIIIPRNSTLPIIKTKKFTTFKHEQSFMTFNIIQGESKKANMCRSLGKFALNNIPKMPAGKIIILVTFQMDSNGILTVSAKEETTGIKSLIKLTPASNLTEKKIIEMIKNHKKSNKTT